MKRIGFIINSRYPEWHGLLRGMRPHHLLTGWPDYASPMHFMRYGWVAEAVNRTSETGLRYELFKPWRHYDAVVFLKSMAAGCVDHAQRLRERGVTVIFEANVDYYNEGIEPLPVGHLKSTKEQRRQAVAMTTGSSGVIASSSHLAGICRDMNPTTFWVPDHIPRRMIPRREGCEPSMVDPLHIWWSGMPDKTGDLLVAGEALQSMGKRIRLHLVTGDLRSAMRDMDAATTEKLESLLSSVPHTIHRFRTINDLLTLYAETRGVIISPRFLDNPYNQSHTEWKITLGMACGLPAIASPQQSYLDVLERAADPSAVTICRNSEEWREALESALEGSRHIVASDSARRTVETHYVSEVVARKHLEAVHAILAS